MIGLLAGSPRRRLASGGTLILLLLFLAAGVWAARQDVRPQFLPPPAQPIFGEPAGLVPSSPPPPTPTPSPSPSPSVSSSPTPSASASSRRPASSRPRVKPSARRTTAPPAAAFDADYTIMTSRRDSSFQVFISLRNEGKAGAWEIRVTHDPSDGVRFQGGMGARFSTSGNTITISGGPLAAGERTVMGFRATKTTRGVARPTSCRVQGRECDVSVR